MRIFLLSAMFACCLIFVIPHDAQAALVPCGTADHPCRSCDFVALGSNLLKWLISIMATICAIVVAMAGFKMVTAGGDSGAISEARGMITNVVIGFVILLAAWLIVDTIMKALTNESGFGPWNEIKCVPQTTGGGGEGGDQCATADNPEACRCEAKGGVWNLTTNSCDGGEVSQCSVPALTDITDSLALQMEGGATLIWSGTAPGLQACANKFTGLTGGSVTSAYRPAAYQTHLYEVHTKWCQSLSSNTDTACSELKSKVESEMSKHSLSCSRPVGQTSNHSSGRAIDVSGIAHGSQAVLNAAAASCLSWPLGAADPVHYELKSGCTCS